MARLYRQPTPKRPEPGGMGTSHTGTASTTKGKLYQTPNS